MRVRTSFSKLSSSSQWLTPSSLLSSSGWNSSLVAILHQICGTITLFDLASQTCMEICFPQSLPHLTKNLSLCQSQHFHLPFDTIWLTHQHIPLTLGPALSSLLSTVYALHPNTLRLFNSATLASHSSYGATSLSTFDG